MGKLLRIFVLAAAAYAIYTRLQNALQPTPAETRPRLVPHADDEEPVLGYDGMDTQTVIPWLETAELDDDDLRRIRVYEQRNRARQPVLETIDDLLA